MIAVPLLVNPSTKTKVSLVRTETLGAVTGLAPKKPIGPTLSNGRDKNTPVDSNATPKPATPPTKLNVIVSDTTPAVLGPEYIYPLPAELPLKGIRVYVFPAELTTELSVAPPFPFT